MSVLGTLCALGGTEWDTPFTTGILCALAGAVALVLALRLKLHAAVARGVSQLVEGARTANRTLLRFFKSRKGDEGMESGKEDEKAEKGYYAGSCSSLNLPALPRAALLV